MRFRFQIGVLLFLAVSSCAEKTKQEVFEVQTIATPALENASLPFLFSNSGTTLLSWVHEENDSLAHLRYSELKDGAWQKAKQITSGANWFVNWADFPSIVANKGHLFSHVLKKSSVGTYSYDVKLNLRRAGTTAWNTDLPLHTDQTATEHGFVTALPYHDDSFFVTWLDGRNTEEKEGQKRGAMTLRSAEVSVNGKIKNEAQLDVRTCDCCQTTAAITENGPVVIYRDRSENEIRDISIVRQIDGEWTAPKAVYNDNWKINGCPVNGPKAAALENTLVVAWFTAANTKPLVKIAFSKDNGATFDPPIEIGLSAVMGRVDIVLIDTETALVSYMQSDGNKGQLKAVKVKSSRTVFPAKTITEMSSTRKSGFPQMELVGDLVLFAWTNVANDQSTIRTASISVAAF